jgi:hypothetical protein
MALTKEFMENLMGKNEVAATALGMLAAFSWEALESTCLKLDEVGLRGQDLADVFQNACGRNIPRFIDYVAALNPELTQL